MFDLNSILPRSQTLFDDLMFPTGCHRSQFYGYFNRRSTLVSIVAFYQKHCYSQELRQHSQVVRQRSAKPPSPSSNLGAAFNRNLAYSGVFVFLPISRALPDWGKVVFYSGTLGYVRGKRWGKI
jgi:hypothetical protein